VPDDGWRPNLGVVADFAATTQDTGKPPAANQPSTNALFIEAQRLIPATPPVVGKSEFDAVLRPFTAQVFASNVTDSQGEGFVKIGALALVELEDGDILVSGGPNRGWLYRLGHDGGRVGSPAAELEVPIYDLALASDGRLWATTGGGVLLELDADSLEILARHGDGLTQSLAIDPASGLIYVSSGDGVEVFDPVTLGFHHFSDIRVDDLAFSLQGELWGSAWPERGRLVKFDAFGRAHTQVELPGEVDSLAFGQAATTLEDLLFVSANDGQLFLVDSATLRWVTLAAGGSRGEGVLATSDGRLLVAQSEQVDVLSPLLAPKVVSSNPPDQAVVPLPMAQITVSFDQAMLAETPAEFTKDEDGNPIVDPDAPASVLNPANYTLLGPDGSALSIESLAWDAATHSVSIAFAPLLAGAHELRLAATLQSSEGVALGTEYVSHFATVLDFSSQVSLEFRDSRSSRADGTVSWEVRVTNIGDYELRPPLTLLLDPAAWFLGAPQGVSVGEGLWRIDLGDTVLAPGQSSLAYTVTISNPQGQHLSLGQAVYAVPYPNELPIIDSLPLLDAAAGQAYAYQAQAHDPESGGLSWLLLDGPDGMTLSPSGLLTWTPDASSLADPDITLRVYDSRGGYASQAFQIAVEGGNHMPEPVRISSELYGREGEAMEIALSSFDADGDPLHWFASDLPPGAVLDAERQALLWTPDYESAGSYEVVISVSDGLVAVSRGITLLIEPANAVPSLAPVASMTVREGDPIRLQLRGSDVDGGSLTYFSPLLPAWALLDRNTDVFEWTPAYCQAGEYDIPFMVSDGVDETTIHARFTVLNVNAAPVFEVASDWSLFEGQALSLRAFAYDADNPAYTAPDRLYDGSLSPLEGSLPSVSYGVSGLPAGAAFDADTGMLTWHPGFNQAGQYSVVFTASDDGNGTAVPLSVSTTVNVNVLNANRAPQLTAIVNHSVARGAVLEIPVSASDPDGNPLVLTASGLPDFASFVDHGDGSGLLRFAPDFGDRGDYAITLTASDDGDGTGLLRSATTTFILAATSAAEPPHLDFIGDKLAVLGQRLAFTLHAHDLDQDVLSFTADNLPAVASLTALPVYGTALFEWTPGSLGVYDLTLRVSDDGNGGQGPVGSAERGLRIVVRDSNQAPTLEPVGNLSAQEGVAFTLQLVGHDLDGDPLTYSATNLPAGASLDPTSGLLTWTPNLYQAGAYKVAFSVTDGNRTASETVSLHVANTNQAPILLPLPIQLGREGAELKFTLTAADADGDALRFVADTLPAGSQFDSAAGTFTWTPAFDQAGNTTLRFAVLDPSGSESSQDVVARIANVNRAPDLNVSSHSVSVGETLQFALAGHDPDTGTTLVYSAQNLPEGATLDPATGAFVWAPTPAQIGEWLVLATVSDGTASVTEPLVLRTSLTPILPTVVIERTPGFPVVSGQQMLVHVAADALSGIVSMSLSANGEAVALDGDGRARLSINGDVDLLASATDADGNTGYATTRIRMRNPADTTAPNVAFGSEWLAARITSVSDLTGSVSDVDLDFWRLELARAGSDTWITLAEGGDEVDGVLTALDPTRFADGFYRLRLSAQDVVGRTNEAETRIELSAPAKAAHYTRTETDFTATLAGHSLAFTRLYDSLEALDSGSFGPGWRLTLFDLAAMSDSEGGFRAGTRVVVTLPDGSRAGFSFAPQRHDQAGLTWYSAAFVADAGVTWSLTAPETELMRAGDRYYDLSSGRAYTGGNYWLTAPDGSLYQFLDNSLRAIQFSDGVRLDVADSGIHAADGSAIRFITDESGRIGRVVAPDGREFLYSYDARGDLAQVRDLSAAQSARYGYDASHRLTLAVNATGGEAVEYSGGGVVTHALTADLGSALNYLAAPVAGSLTAGAVDRYGFTPRASELAATAGGALWLGVMLEGEGGLTPDLPRIAGLTPLSSNIIGNRAFALYRIDQALLHLLEVSGSGAGNYQLTLFAAGDANRDLRVDGVDAALLAGASGYVQAYDANLDGVLNASDRQLLMQNLGYTVNRPPSVNGGSFSTHMELEATALATNFVSDPEHDPIRIRVSIVDATQGTAWLSGDGESVVFLPKAGFSGQATITLIADDGYASSTGVVTVNVSDKPLADLRFSFDHPILGEGESIAFQVIGDFADQSNVTLPESYVDVVSSDAAIASVSTGWLQAGDQGHALLTATRNGLTAATVANVLHIDPEYPEGALYDVPLPVQTTPGALALLPGEAVQLTLPEAMLLEIAASGLPAQFVVSDPDVVQIAADGTVTALTEGQASIAVFAGGWEAHVPVSVSQARTGSASLGTAGGIVASASGSMIAIPPDALAADTPVLFSDLAAADLPLATAEPFRYAAGFHLEVGDDALGVAPRMAVKVGADVPVGSLVILYRHDRIDDSLEGWAQVAEGAVDSDGFAHFSETSGPGVLVSADYYVAWYLPGTVGTVQLELTGTEPFADTMRGVVAYITLHGPTPLRAALPEGAQAEETEPELHYLMVNGTYTTYSQMNFNAPASKVTIRIQTLDASGLSAETVTEVQVNPGMLTKLSKEMSNPPGGVAQLAQPPVVTKVEFEFLQSVGGTGEVIVTPTVKLTGQRFLRPLKPGETLTNAVGARQKDLTVRFVLSHEKLNKEMTGNLYWADWIEGKDYFDVRGSSADFVLEENNTVVKVKVPQEIALGQASIVLVRTQKQAHVDDATSKVVNKTIPKYSNVVRVSPEQAYLFAPVFKYRSGDTGGSLAVIGADASNATTWNKLVANVPIGRNARWAAVTPDGTRVYVTDPWNSDVAMVDTIALQQVDSHPDWSNGQGIDTIHLGGYPFAIAIDPEGDYAYVTDQSAPVIYVIGVNASKPDQYHKEIACIQVEAQEGEAPPNGLRGLTVVTLEGDDGKPVNRLFVAAPARGVAGKPQPGDLICFEISKVYYGIEWNQLFRMPTGIMPYGVSATDDPEKIVFTNWDTDGKGLVGVQYPEDESLLSLSDTNLTLGNFSESFDVNNAVAAVVVPEKGERPAYAFVSGYNRFIEGDKSHDPTQNLFLPAGGNIGIVRDPFGDYPKLVAATRPIPQAYPDNLVLSEDGRYLYAAYSNIQAVFVFDVERMLAAVENQPYTPPGAPTTLESTPIEEADPEILVQANYVSLNTGPTGGSYGIDFGVPPGKESEGPIGVGGQVRGIALQRVPVKVKTDGHLGDVIEVKLATQAADSLKKLLGEDIAGTDLSDFRLNLDTFAGGKVATYKTEEANGNDAEEKIVVENMDKTGKVDKVDSFEKTGTFYFVPVVDPDLALRWRSNANPFNPSTSFGGFSFVYKGVRYSGTVQINVDNDYSKIELVGENVKLDGVNRPLDVYRVEQRLKYLGFPGYGGNIAYKHQASHVYLTPDGVIKSETLNFGEHYLELEALCLMDALVNNHPLYGTDWYGKAKWDGGANTQRSVNEVSPDTISVGSGSFGLLEWMNADVAPHWVAVIDKQAGKPFEIQSNSVYRDVPVGQDEAFGSLWLVELFENATDKFQDSYGKMKNGVFPSLNGLSDIYGEFYKSHSWKGHTNGNHIDIGGWTGNLPVETFTWAWDADKVEHKTPINKGWNNDAYVNYYTADTLPGVPEEERLKSNERKLVLFMIDFMKAMDEIKENNSGLQKQPGPIFIGDKDPAAETKKINFDYYTMEVVRDVKNYTLHKRLLHGDGTPMEVTVELPIYQLVNGKYVEIEDNRDYPALREALAVLGIPTSPEESHHHHFHISGRPQI